MTRRTISSISFYLGEETDGDLLFYDKDDHDRLLHRVVISRTASSRSTGRVRTRRLRQRTTNSACR